MRRWRLPSQRRGGRRLLRFSSGGYRRFALPVTAILVMVIGGVALHVTGLATPAEMHLLRLAMVLLGAMAAIRLFVYILRRSLPRAAWIGSFELRDCADHLAHGCAVPHRRCWATWSVISTAFAFPVGKTPLTLWDILAGRGQCRSDCAGRPVGRIGIEARLMGASRSHRTRASCWSRVVKAVLTVLAVLVAFSVVGIDLTVLSVFGGALGVGLGLGLQRIASNYVSGFIILLDRTCRSAT